MSTSSIEADSNDSLVVSGDIPSAVVEVFVESKSPKSPSEDVVVITDDFAAVLDGMSSPLRDSDHHASGRDFALRAAAAIVQMPPFVGARKAVDLITSAAAGVHASHRGPYGVVGAIYSFARGEVWRVGDVHVAIAGRNYPAQKEIDRVFSEFRAVINLAAIHNGVSGNEVRSSDPGAAAAAPLLEAQTAFANKTGPFGYGVFDGSRVPDDHIEVFTVDRSEAVVLASDGFLSAAPELHQAQVDLAQAVRLDPLCVRKLRGMGKPMVEGAVAPDDRSYVRIESQDGCA